MESDRPSGGTDYQEWTLPVTGAGTVLALAKHITPRVNSSVLYSDIADAIDSGEGASEGKRAASLLGCGANGGMVGVTNADPKNPEYATEKYLAGKYKPSGILIKLVRAPVP
jgi:hypothetical protein